MAKKHLEQLMNNFGKKDFPPLPPKPPSVVEPPKKLEAPPVAIQQPEQPFANRTAANAAKLRRAHATLDRLFQLAEDGWINEDKFWGAVTLVIAFQDGDARDIKSHLETRDKGG